MSGSPTLTSDGYPVAGGTSFIYALECTRRGPKAAGFVTYGQSGDPASPHLSDQTIRFAEKDWRPFAFTQRQIRRDPELERYVVRSGGCRPARHC